MNFTEREMEDWVEVNIRQVLGLEPWEDVHVARQVTLPTGRVVDLLATYESDPVMVHNILELKAVTVDSHALAQLLDYMAGFDYGLARYSNEAQGTPLSQPMELRGHLVGPAISEEVALALNYLPSVRFTRVAPTFRASFLAPEGRGRRYNDDLTAGFRDIMGQAVVDLSEAVARDREELDEVMEELDG